MDSANRLPDHGRYTLIRLGQELHHQAPRLLAGLGPYVRSQLEGGGLRPETHLAVLLRMARLQGCPLCLKLFPRLGPRMGLTDQAVQSALDGSPQHLSTETQAALAWIEAITLGRGDEPEVVPGPAMALSAGQRSSLLFRARLSLLIHATGLMFLPHALIERARARS